MRLAIITRNYAEYSLRYAIAAARVAEVLLIVDDRLARAEWPEAGPEIHPNLTIVRADLGIKRGIRGVVTAVRTVAGFKPDYAHFQEAPNLTMPILMLAIRPFARLILTVHDPKPHSGSVSRPMFLNDWLMSLGRMMASTIVVHGKYNERAFVQARPREARKVVRSQHGVLMVPHGDCNIRKPGSILMFGRMHSYKGLDTLIAASDILAQRGVKHKIVVAGSGPEADRLLHQMQCRKAFELRRRYITPSEAGELFQSSDAVVLPYLDATQSGVAMAAFANGQAVVASRTGGLIDVIDDGVNGLLVEPGSAVALADCLQRVLHDDALRLQLRAGARQTAATTLNWNHIADELIGELRARL